MWGVEGVQCRPITDRLPTARQQHQGTAERVCIAGCAASQCFPTAPPSLAASLEVARLTEAARDHFPFSVAPLPIHANPSAAQPTNHMLSYVSV